MAAKKARPSKADDCVIPTRPKPELLRASLVESSPHEEADIARYFEWESSRDPKGPAFVEHLELVKSETVFGREYKVWDVHATDGRWWVVADSDEDDHSFRSKAATRRSEATSSGSC
jgi:hypothetical protein